MKFCIYCGHALPENTKFCTNCGKKQIQNKTIQEDDWMDNQENAIEYSGKSRNGKIFKAVIIVAVCVLAAGILWKTGVFQKNTEKELAPTKKSSQEAVISDSKDKKIKKKTDTPASDTTVQDKKQVVQQDNNMPAQTEQKQNETVSTDEYILPTDTQYISESDLQGLTQEQVALARNEVYARHGYIFKNEDYQKYFSSKSWYKPDATYQPTDDTLSKIEKANVDLIVKYEVSKGWRAS